MQHLPGFLVPGSRLYRHPAAANSPGKFRLQDGTTCLFFNLDGPTPSHGVFACIGGDPVIPHSSATGQLFLVSTRLAYELTAYGTPSKEV
jgi:hypothetical protein